MKTRAKLAACSPPRAQGRKLERVPATCGRGTRSTLMGRPVTLRTGAPHNKFADPKQRLACCISSSPPAPISGGAALVTSLEGCFGRRSPSD